MKHDVKGVVSMWNVFGRGHVGSRFNITARPLPQWNGWNVAFGKVTNETYHVVETIMKVKTNMFTPQEDIIIRNCGVL